MPALSSLEGLPLELLEKIFIESQNCDLPLTSRTLLQLLSSRHLIRLMARTMLSSNNAAAQSYLLTRRFLTPALFGSITREITPPCMPPCTASSKFCSNGFRLDTIPPSAPTAPHFTFGSGIRLCPRLLCGRLAHQSAEEYRSSASARLAMLYLVIGGGANIFVLCSAPMHAAALGALQDALDHGLQDVVEIFMNRIGWPLCKPPLEMRRAALMSPALDFRTLGYFLVGVVGPGREHEISGDKLLRTWVMARVREDRRWRRVEKARGESEGEGERGAELLLLLWKGEWLESMLYRGANYQTYISYLRSRNFEVVDNAVESVSDELRLAMSGG
ncbi:MAG: hypothetical protein M1829_002636 [Trizodia sp. TS-e1964]|nr:MAG: hypothetical protein M1829_002636 [Trizodia sp. TS-e1964]